MEVWIGRTAVAAVLLLADCAGTAPASSRAQDAASHEQSASAAATASASTDPMVACAGVEADGEPFEVALETISYAFDTELIEGPTHCQPFVITLTTTIESRARSPRTGTTSTSAPTTCWATSSSTVS